MYIKDFDTWLISKKKLDGENKPLSIRAGDIRWAAIGINIGSEIDGKGKNATRPVLVLYVINRSLALVAPMTTKLKVRNGHYKFQQKEKDVSICLDQIKVISPKRVFRRIEKISDKRLAEVKTAVKNFYGLG